MNDLVKYEQRLPATAADMRARVNLVQEVMKAVMQEGTHYGKIPGTPKPSLWKPGSEVLCATFHIAPSYRVEDLSTDDVARYRVVCVGTHQATGIVMAEGMGECSSNEEKYKWRKANSKREFEATAENRKRIKYGYDRTERREYEIQQVRTEAADVANTILKMACKRAQVAMTLNATAASDIFTQDIEDLPEELRHDDDAAPATATTPVPGPQTKSAAPKQAEPEQAAPKTNGHSAQPITPGALKMLKSTMARSGKTDAALKAQFQFDSAEVVTMDRINEVLKWVTG